MDREKKLQQIAGEYLKEIYYARLEEIRDYYRIHEKEIMEQFCEKLQEGVGKCIELNKEVRYVVISILESSILTKTYDLQIAFYDDRLYLDEKAVYIYWLPSFIFAHIADDMAAFQKKASQTVIRIREYEIERVKRQYAVNHYYQVSVLLRKMLPEILKQERKELKVLTKKIDFLYGRYMERPMLLYPQEKQRKRG